MESRPVDRAAAFRRLAHLYLLGAAGGIATSIIGVGCGILIGYWIQFAPVIAGGALVVALSGIGWWRASKSAARVKNAEPVQLSPAAVQRLERLVNASSWVVIIGALVGATGVALAIAQPSSPVGFMLSAVGLVICSGGLGLRRGGKRLIAASLRH